MIVKLTTAPAEVPAELIELIVKAVLPMVVEGVPEITQLLG